MIDVDKIRKALACMAVEDYDAMSMIYGNPVDFGTDMGAALDELEALRKPASVTAYSFDMAAASEERARIDAAWGSHDADDKSDAFRAALALLDKVLAAIDAGWPAVDIEGAAIAAWAANGNASAEKWTGIREEGRVEFREIARAVLEYAASIGIGAPVDDTMDTAERVARVMWMGLGSFDDASPETRALHIARARDAVAFADDPRLTIHEVKHVPTVDPREERLDRCRDRAARYVAERGVPESWDVTDRAQEIEAQAHAMLAAERSPDRG